MLIAKSTDTAVRERQPDTENSRSANTGETFRAYISEVCMQISKLKAL